jgi:putative component of membrane protein insertase Oxa1/YidC/SpoIIIJ protein YidD
VRIVLLALALALTIDLARAPSSQWSARALLGAIDLYQATLSTKWIKFGVRCRFTPSCSLYAEGAIREDGALVGTARAVGRVARCGPWTPAGTHDPP